MQCAMVAIVNNNRVAYLEVATRVGLKCFHHKKMNSVTTIDVNLTYCDHFAICTDSRPVCGAPETNMLLYVHHLSI